MASSISATGGVEILQPGERIGEKDLSLDVAGRHGERLLCSVRLASSNRRPNSRLLPALTCTSGRSGKTSAART